MSVVEYPSSILPKPLLRGHNSVDSPAWQKIEVFEGLARYRERPPGYSTISFTFQFTAREYNYWKSWRRQQLKNSFMRIEVPIGDVDPYLEGQQSAQQFVNRNTAIDAHLLEQPEEFRNQDGLWEVTCVLEYRSPTIPNRFVVEAFSDGGAPGSPPTDISDGGDPSDPPLNIVDSLSPSIWISI